MNTQALLKHYRLTQKEYQLICQYLHHTPSRLELALFSALWSEHCSYKSSILHLKKMFFSSPIVVSERGENAGVIDLGQGEKVAFKIESHNHPSQITPYHGASTGVGGILRDVFIMNARPLALSNFLCFGTPATAQTADLLDGVVRGIGGYGNSIGIPTLTGQTEFHPSYNKNILVNAFALGYFGPKDKIISSKAKGTGQLLVYVGAPTGRDGIHGASMASESFMKQSHHSPSKIKKKEHLNQTGFEKGAALEVFPSYEVHVKQELSNKISLTEKNKASVQIGDPFYGKLLMSACLEVFKKDLVVAGQDMGAAGLISSSFEMISKGQMGMKMQLDKVPLRDTTMTPEEILLSESQERALLLVKSEKYNEVKQVFEKWGLPAQAIAKLTQKKEVTICWNKKRLVCINPTLLTEKAPRYNRPYHPWKAFCQAENKEEIDRASHKITSTLYQTENKKNLLQVKNQADTQHHQSSPLNLLLSLLKDIRGTDRSFIYQQYDQRVGTSTVKDSSFPIGVIRLPHSHRNLAIRTGGRPHIMRMDSYEGGKDSVYEPALQLTIRGFKPLALTDGLNFGSPENPKVMSEFVACVQGIAQASQALKTPVISGNVSFYNETAGKSITPTPATVMVGLRRVTRRAGGHATRAGNIDADPAFDRDTVPNTPLLYLISAHQLFCKGLISEVAHQSNGFYGSLRSQITKNFIHKILKATHIAPPLTTRMVGKFGLLYTLSHILPPPCRRGHLTPHHPNKPHPTPSLQQNLTLPIPTELPESYAGLKIQTSYDPFQERLYEFVALLKPESVPVWQNIFLKTTLQTLKHTPKKLQNITNQDDHPVFKMEKIGKAIKEPILCFNKENLKVEELKKAYKSGWNLAFKHSSAEHDQCP